MGEKEECNSVHDVEEGEISDSASVEEISEEDFRKQEAKVFNPNDSNNSNSNPRVWTMRDLYKYQVARNYSSVNLHNIAWAHAVQNKPLDGVLVMDLKPNETSNSKRSSNSLNSTEHNNNNSSGGESVNPEVKVVIDVDDDATKMEARDGGEREEGELEEGEIDLDLEVVERVQRADSDKEEMDISTSDVDLKDKELKVENHVNSIREALGTVNTNAVEKSFGGVCARLENSLYSLGEYFMDNSSTEKDFLIQLSLTAIDIANSVFWSMNQSLKEQNRDILSRLLHNVMRHKAHHLFSPEQMREIEAMIASLDSFAVSTSTADVDEKKKIQMNGRVNRSDFYTSNENFDKNLISSKKRGLDSMSVEPLERNDPQMSWESSNSGHPSSKGRGLLLPLLDLHKDHDVDSLPSPTRETPTCFPVGKKLALGDGIGKPEPPRTSVAIEMENVLMHPYETDALKAVSSYQEKFGRSSFFTNDRLPSPTPSEEGNDGDADTSGEVSSASRILNVNSLNVPMMSQPRVSSVPHIDVSIGQSQTNTRNVAPLTSVPNHVSRASARSRDPRLRVANPDAGSLPLNQRHHVKTVHTETMLEPLGEILRHRRTAEEAYLDGPTPKKQRNELTDSSVRMDGQAVSVSGGWLDRGTVGLPVANRNHIVDGTRNDPRKMENEVTAPSTCSSVANVPISGNEQLPVTGVSTPASLQSLLKDIALNPAVWRNIIKMEQQKSVDPERSLTQPPSSNSILGAVPATTTAPTKPSVLVQGLAAMLQSPTTDSMDALGKARMKPRDPRRVLLNQTLQKGVNLGSDQSNGSSTQTQKQDDLPDQKSLSSPSSTPPDITEQFTKNLRHVADIVAVSQASTPPPSVTHIAASQTAQVHPSRVEVKVSSASDDLQSGAGLTSEEAVPSRPQNSWGDVEHLFEGFDDQQKAAFQKERARRIEEQNKMFASRKLCLVLDLDHTLLNSAKFAEVDPVHDDILRKKEEQDREKPQRHLFRFPHMGMWTKLRPGIWNFLEKASKLYELHLYTMGNRIYATEMAKLIDPKGNLFAGRVISRGDDGDISDGDERVPKSKDLEGVLGMESAVVIVDDSVRVWPHNRLNLIVVERYIYFPCSRRQFGLVGPSLLEIDHDERPEDGTLASSLAVIERIHQNFFSRNCLEEVDVRNILSSEQRKILGGCRIVFSRVFPVGEANPHLHPLWQTAEQFGAVCTNQIDEQVTHVVANSLGTDKVNWALSTGRFVVHPGWVEASALLYRRANEHDFAIKQ